MAPDVFISGISGFIGQTLAAYLKSCGYAVSGLARRPFQLDGRAVIQGDILDQTGYADEARRCQIVIHLAAPTLAAEIAEQPLSALKVNVIGLLNMLECFEQGAGQHFIMVSSGKVYGPCSALPVNETQELKPSTALGRAKKAAEELVSYFAEYSQKRYNILRLFNAYGPGQQRGFLIPSILEQIDKGQITLGDIRGRRDFIFIDDVIEAINCVIGSSVNRPIADRLGIFNVGTGKSYSPADIVHKLETIVHRKLTITVDKQRLRQGEPDEERADVGRLMALGWSPKTDLHEGLERTLKGGAYATGSLA